MEATPDTAPSLIVVAGASGALGERIVANLLGRGATVRAIVRPDTTVADVHALERQGVAIARAAYDRPDQLEAACDGAACVVSVLSGLEDVIVEAQTALLEAAVRAGVPRFIPSDYAIDFTKLRPGSNRNLDLRRRFMQRLDRAPIAATSVLNGMFTELLAGQAPLVLFPLNRVLYWGDPDQLMDFTTRDDTAAFTAAAALDPSAPRYLRIAGDQQSVRGLAEVASQVTGERFRPFRAGGLGGLDLLIRIVRFIAPARDVVFPPWQGMQYLRDMFSGEAKLEPLDNGRYPDIEWTTVRDVLAAR